jgi:hypothetical protein
VTYRSIPYALISTPSGWLALAWIGPHVVFRDAPTADTAETAIRAVIDWSVQ